MQLRRQHTETELPTAPDEKQISINHKGLHLQTQNPENPVFSADWVVVLNPYLDAVVPTQLLSIQSWAVDGVEC